MRRTAEAGFSLVEVIFALGILTVGVLGTAAVMTTGMQQLSTSPSDVIVTQKAAQAVEAVFAARDSHKLTWDQIQNVQGASGTDGGVFVDGPLPLNLSGADGLVNTADDPSTIESNTLPGIDQVSGTSDDRTVELAGFTREIKIRDVAGENGQLREITVTITYTGAGRERTYTLTSFISAYA
jgi:Tfp pilus assembly protein PilV